MRKIILDKLKRIFNDKSIYFYIAYILFFTSWVIDDIAFLYDINSFKKIIRILSYVFLVLQFSCVYKELLKKVSLWLGIIIGILYVISTGEVYILALIIILLLSTTVDFKNILKLSFFILLFSTIIVGILCIFGVTENLVTVRGIGGDFRPRYSLGFYHSNVLPLQFFYMVSYVLLLKKGNTKNGTLLLLLIINLVIYKICLSRVTFLVTMLMIVFVYLIKRYPVKQNIVNIFYKLSKYIIILYSLISIACVYLYSIGNSLMLKLDIVLLSGRIEYAFRKMESIGLRVFKPLNYSGYANDLIIVDNGYLSLILRYGIFFILLMGFLNFYGINRVKKSLFVYIPILAIASVNFIDNDLLSYACYPIWLGAICMIQKKGEIYKSDDMVTILMSTYNETSKDLKASIESILCQSYTNFEFIIINDNPANEELNGILKHYSILDSRIRLILNERNLGLVNSLNKGLSVAKGNYILRMDADDISNSYRLESQLRFIKKMNYDMVGADIELIDETGASIKGMKFPCYNYQIRKIIKWRNCIPHPTWLVKKSVYEQLEGYRDIPHCEDYDFILRCIVRGYKVGNVSDYLLQYRVRRNGISESNKISQLLTRYYVFENRKRLVDIDCKSISQYLNSEKTVLYSKYDNCKKQIKMLLKRKKIVEAIYVSHSLFISKYLYINLLERFYSWYYE